MFKEREKCALPVGGNSRDATAAFNVSGSGGDLVDGNFS